ncbi:MAG: VanZ family protein [Fuerstiella sp.]
MTKRRWIAPICCLVWAASIFATSSTVITPHAFFAWCHENIFQDDAVFREFQIFWGVSWFIIVKGWHVLEFAILMLLGTLVIDALTARRNVGNALAAAALCLAYAASDEWHQTFVPDRGGIFSDVLIDSLGVILTGLYLYRGRRSLAPPAVQQFRN